MKQWTKLKNWKSIADVFPDDKKGVAAYFISGHEWFGIGIWRPGKGWIRGFIGEWPYGDEGEMIQEPSQFLNDEVMHWCDIVGYEIYGIRMGDLEKKP